MDKNSFNQFLKRLENENRKFILKTKINDAIIYELNRFQNELLQRNATIIYRIQNNDLNQPRILIEIVDLISLLVSFTFSLKQIYENEILISSDIPKNLLKQAEKCVNDSNANINQFYNHMEQFVIPNINRFTPSQKITLHRNLGRIKHYIETGIRGEFVDRSYFGKRKSKIRLTN